MADKKKISRRQLREDTFVLCFENLFKEISIEEAVEAAKEADDKEYDAYSIACASAIEEKKEELDEIIEKHLKKSWKISRISKVSHAILRLATYEIKYIDDIPCAVSINEAVELAKKYTVPDDSSFINGVLGAIVRDNNG